MKIMLKRRARLLRSVLIPAVGLVASAVYAQTISAPYAGSYSLTSLGSVAGVPAPYGGLTLLAANNNTLLLGGAANGAAGAIYSIGVSRNSGGHITGFLGSATLFATAPNIDGGLTYGPGGVLFYTGYPNNALGQIKPGSATTDKTVSLSPLGVSGSVGSLVFAPNGSLKLLSYGTSTWYSAALNPDGAGTFNVTGVTLNTTLQGGLEGAAYVPAGSAVFASGSVLVAEYSLGSIAAYQTDANFNPLSATRSIFVSGLSGAEGAFIDPVTGDFLFSTFGGTNQVVRVSGFTAPPTQPPVSGVPDGGTAFSLLSIALLALAAFRRHLGRV